jgi:hypothetical protein
MTSWSKDRHSTRHLLTQGSQGLNARHQLGQQGVVMFG